MKIIDFIVFTGGPRAYAPNRLRKEAKKNNIIFRAYLYKYLNIKLNGAPQNYIFSYKGRELPPAKGVFLRALGEMAEYNPYKYFLIDWFESKSAKVINSASFKKWPSLDKTSQHLVYLKNDIPFINSAVFGSQESATAWANPSRFPFIVKSNVGSCGTEVYKIKSRRALKRLLKPFNKRTVKGLLFQEFLPGGEDLRVIVLNGKVLGAMKRIASKGNYLTNYSRGGSVENYDLTGDASASKIALKVTDTFSLDYCGVDLMRGKDGGWKVLEVNRACQFEGFEKATGVNVAKKVLEFAVG
ncbi:hypothetical protein A3D84_02120 [Candidatus Woesebacteria bacterium RIFCSPHIGHO2_02_FULL_42_20]|uniref:ATP-grasp domain-containing protein n=1 Tax=Candidatus Woesebacteria bacterium RIFCSPHIGHO2_12_FULL_41_24 TaxID=1802510 RepID=A0A1F8ASX9_9BACT|nr:MAG: hypothetical protein A2W15_04400 [Candidatus Woesebacteria bacterium RBG_16_41_13]OGM30043.1 MAG: hypothetical protein A2873_04955 [Candidatus Woesebacteria bacterium RIFCSPHIGHO2_01_FULL_42_80]OGM35121.1 MAG: hypothetical protein A3D84_02120 [Candidatus Woesebacteria bacterium RIFCSPHIGHO2_02_FULL_42_20]OGM54857.1 MAG: hypothetical protein A3E44_01720 [Candidatus Woesebacteria bacterium RIFCSPHIGHO2_12_FULL_41_24]OGM67473.1 MAG: hypothetical protein A2969_05570 [Candidatus Woesebacteri